MLSAITGLLGVWGSLAAVAAILAAASVFLWRVRAGGARAAVERQRKADERARHKSDEIEDAVASRTGAENREELRRWGKG